MGRCRLGKDNFRWIGGNDYGGEWMREQAEKLDLKVRSVPLQINCIT